MSLIIGSIVYRFLKISCVTLLLLTSLVQADSIFTHVHMRIPDTAKAAEWHETLLGGSVGPGGPGPNISYANGFVGTVSNEGVAPASVGGVIDHFGISVADVTATVAKAREMGAKIMTEPRVGVTAPVIAFIEDPWGVRMELLEDPEYPGVNHVHLMANDPVKMRDWFLQVFGGEYVEARGKGQFHTILYKDFWVHVSKTPGEPRAPSQGRAIDHMGFRVPSLDAFRPILKGSGYEPYLERPNPPRSDLMFFIGPEGVHFEIAEEIPG